MTPFDPRTLLLASASPRRRELLADAGFQPVIRPADLPEAIAPGEPPDHYVLRLASEKARAVANLLPHPVARENPFVLAADTTVVAPDGRVLEKPSSAAHAHAMLRALSGAAHRVLTGVALADRRMPGAAPHTLVVETRVHFAPLDDDTIARYVATGEPMDKAGAYGIQGLAGCFVERIEGSWSNVVGLPIQQTLALLRQAGALEAWPFAATDTYPEEDPEP